MIIRFVGSQRETCTVDAALFKQSKQGKGGAKIHKVGKQNSPSKCHVLEWTVSAKSSVKNLKTCWEIQRKQLISN